MKHAKMKRLHVTPLGFQAQNLSYEIIQAQSMPNVQYLLVIWLLDANERLLIGLSRMETFLLSCMEAFVLHTLIKDELQVDTMHAIR